MTQAKLEFEPRAKFADSVDLPPPISKELVKTEKEAEAHEKEKAHEEEEAVFSRSSSNMAR